MTKKTNNVAIIGASGRFPKSKNLRRFWENIVKERNLISEVPQDRWDWKQHYSSQKNKINKTLSKWGGFLEDVAFFDAPFFKISRREANLMDPQQRIVLELVWEALEDAGYRASEMIGSKTGVFIGACHHDYSELMDQTLEEINAYITTGTCYSILSNRVSFFYGFRGPSISVNTACSSSLVSVHQAVQSLLTNESDLAVAGGVQICLTPKLFIASSRAGMLAKDGRCKTFSQEADGYVRGEGAGIILLKPLEKAIEDKDNIYAVLRGSAINHGGKVNSITVPNPNAQAEVIKAAFQNAKIKPDHISYIEAHGTGTALGDPIEIFGLQKAFALLNKNKPGAKKKYCGLGSVKTNMGHLEGAAGIAGLIKVLLSIKHKKLPATLNLEKANRLIKLKDSPFYFVRKTKEWHPLKEKNGKQIPRIAGVSSFGFGGANAHIVLGEYEKKQKAQVLKNQGPQIVLLSARDEKRLKEYIKAYIEFIDFHWESDTKDKQLDIADIAYTLQFGREPMEERLALIVENINQLKQSLIDTLEQKNPKKKKHHRYQGNINSENAVKMKNEKDIVNTALNKKDLDTLSQLWISGATIDWK
ncbi:MAG: polyketide synthase, partial [Proteobacteria bacterium]|nr:polyketide synthase [Pseudomonadota bacterium]